jgi:hypothetical protein
VALASAELAKAVGGNHNPQAGGRALHRGGEAGGRARPGAPRASERASTTPPAGPAGAGAIPPSTWAWEPWTGSEIPSRGSQTRFWAGYPGCF